MLILTTLYPPKSNPKLIQSLQPTKYLMKTSATDKVREFRVFETSVEYDGIFG
jgi:hypothetical protein